MNERSEDMLTDRAPASRAAMGSGGASPREGMNDVVLVEVADRIATVTLNRPEARNALSVELLQALPAAVQECDESEDVDVIIVTGADPAFCAGLDLKELGGGGANLSVAPRNPLGTPAKPVIGAINGSAVTGGFELALACDFLVASERAVFADTHARVGVMPGWGLTVLLPQAIGVRRAREMSITGNFLDAPMALAWGLVNHVVEHDKLLPFCRGLAADVISNDQRGVRRMLQTYAEGSLVTAGEAWLIESEVSKGWRTDAEEIERRRQAIVERGRSQAG